MIKIACDGFTDRECIAVLAKFLVELSAKQADAEGAVSQVFHYLDVKFQQLREEAKNAGEG